MPDYPQYTWNKKEGGSKKDPINLIFSNTTIEKILSDLEFSGWSHYNGLIRLAWIQYVPDDSPRKPEDAQFVKGYFWERFHARIWNFSKESYVGSAHFEKFSLGRGHDAYGFEPGKHQMQDDLHGPSWKIEKDKHNLENYTRKSFGSGKATEFTEI